MNTGAATRSDINSKRDILSASTRVRYAFSGPWVKATWIRPHAATRNRRLGNASWRGGSDTDHPWIWRPELPRPVVVADRLLSYSVAHEDSGSSSPQAERIFGGCGRLRRRSRDDHRSWPARRATRADTVEPPRSSRRRTASQTGEALAA